MRLARPCIEPGCPEVATHRSRCASHQRQYNNTPYRVTQRSFYASKHWRLVRDLILLRDPVCRASGCNARSTDVDHITPISQGGPPFQASNLQGLCHAHHSAKTVGGLNHHKGNVPEARTTRLAPCIGPEV